MYLVCNTYIYIPLQTNNSILYMCFCVSYIYTCDSELVLARAATVSLKVFTPCCKWPRIDSAMGELFVLQVFCPMCLYNQFSCGNVYTLEKSCRIALKCEETVANEVWEDKCVRMERKMHIWQIGKSEEENGQGENHLLAVLSRQGHLSRELLHQKWPGSQWAHDSSVFGETKWRLFSLKTKLTCL